MLYLPFFSTSRLQNKQFKLNYSTKCFCQKPKDFNFRNFKISSKFSRQASQKVHCQAVLGKQCDWLAANLSVQKKRKFKENVSNWFRCLNLNGRTIFGQCFVRTKLQRIAINTPTLSKRICNHLKAPISNFRIMKVTVKKSTKPNDSMFSFQKVCQC